MTTAHYRQRQRELNAFYDRAAGWLVGASSTLAMLMIAAVLSKWLP